MNADYEKSFENLQIMKANLFNQDKLSNYHEDDMYYYIKTKTSDDIKVRKNRYIIKFKKVESLTKEVEALNKKILSMQKIYILSRVDAYQKELEELFQKRNDKLTKLEILKQSIVAFPDVIFEIVNTEAKEITENIVKSVEKTIIESKSTVKQKQKIKKFLFESYKQCISQKTSDPTYMTKESIIKHIKEHDPNLLKILPKNIALMKKGEICKVLFKVD